MISSDDFYSKLLSEASGLLDGESNYIANCANISSLLYNELNKSLKNNNINWSGFYFVDPSASFPQLVLGPFMGEPACIRIKIGKGVCGTSAETKTTQLIDNVHDFPGHIACDSRSNSELVIPLVSSDGKLIGVLDIDCLIENGFDDTDKINLEKLVQNVVSACNWDSILI